MIEAEGSELWHRPLTLYLRQIATTERGEHHPLLDDSAMSGTSRQLSERSTAAGRRRQTDLLLRLRGACTLARGGA